MKTQRQPFLCKFANNLPEIMVGHYKDTISIKSLGQPHLLILKAIKIKFATYLSIHFHSMTSSFYGLNILPTCVQACHYIININSTCSRTISMISFSVFSHHRLCKIMMKVKFYGFQDYKPKYL